MSWLKNDAKNRAWRTTLQGVGAIVAVPALIAAGEVLLKAMLADTGPSRPPGVTAVQAPATDPTAGRPM